MQETSAHDWTYRNMAQMFGARVVNILHDMDETLNPYLDVSIREDASSAYKEGKPKAVILAEMLVKYVLVGKT